MTVLMHSGSNLIGFREHMDPMYHVRSAEWGGLYPSTMLDVQAGRWKDEGQNDKNVDEQTRAKIAKMPIIFDQDPLDSEEPFDDVIGAVGDEPQATYKGLEKYTGDLMRKQDEVDIMHMNTGPPIAEPTPVPANNLLDDIKRT